MASSTVLTWAGLFPPAGLVLDAGGGTELCYLTDDLLPAVAQVAHDGIHDPSWTPFSAPWADADPLARARSVLAWNWQQRAALGPEQWSLVFAVLQDGVVVGVQDLLAREFAVRREVRTGSWLGLAHQGRGTGTRMRLAVLSLAFDHLGALGAGTEAWKDNAASRRVSEKVGYLPDGEEVAVTRGSRREGWRYRLTAARWQTLGHPGVAVHGLTDACRELLGAR
ncbi:GNAT family N-acetyltransferase [Aquipuribacter hungaricus]|uniref:GNAT family N-acetyltransferase n=1 Tax=Aquipuribacter hungaricus TaxID=545624 RepID=A0ABV7WKI7_9MICO